MVSFHINVDPLPPSEAFPYLGSTIDLQQWRLAVGVSELEENLEILGNDFEGVDKDRRNFAGPWDDAQGSGTDSSSAHQQKLGDDGGDVEDPGGVPPPFGQTNHGDDSKKYGRQEFGISPGGGGTGSNGLTPHLGVHLEKVGNHWGTGDMPPYL